MGDLIPCERDFDPVGVDDGDHVLEGIVVLLEVDRVRDNIGRVFQRNFAVFGWLEKLGAMLVYKLGKLQMAEVFRRLWTAHQVE